MTYEKIVENLQKKFAKADVKEIKAHVAVQVDITGEGEGAFYVEISDGKLAIEPYEYYEHDAKLIVSADNLTAVVDGKLDASVAYNEGLLQVEGNLESAAVLKALIPAKKAAAPAKKAAAPAKKAAAPAKKAAAATKKAAAPAKKAAAAPKVEAKKTEVKPAVKKVETPKKTAPAKKTVAPKAEAKKTEVKPAVKKAETPKKVVAPAKKTVAPKAEVKKAEDKPVIKK